MSEEEAKSYLPGEVKLLLPNPEHLKYLLYAPPKWGKTTFFSGANALLLAYEEGHSFIQMPKMIIDAWNLPMSERGPKTDSETGARYCSSMEAIEALEVYCPYNLIIMDTVDQASKMCTQYHCDKDHIKHPSDGGDYGKGWDLYQTEPFRRFYNRIIKLGVGVALLTHVNEEWKKDKYKQEVFRRETTLPKGIQRFVHAQSDVILNGYWGKWRKGMPDKDRILSMEGSNEVMAGTRVRGVKVPIEYIVSPPTDFDQTVPWQQWNGFFENSPSAGEEADLTYKTTYKSRQNDKVIYAEGDNEDYQIQEKQTKHNTRTNGKATVSEKGNVSSTHKKSSPVAATR